MWTVIACFIFFPMVVAPILFQGANLAGDDDNQRGCLVSTALELSGRILITGAIFAPPTLGTCLIAYGVRRIPLDDYPSLFDCIVGASIGFAAVFAAMQLMPLSLKPDKPRTKRAEVHWRDEIPESHRLSVEWERASDNFRPHQAKEPTRDPSQDEINK